MFVWVRFVRSFLIGGLSSTSVSDSEVGVVSASLGMASSVLK